MIDLTFSPSGKVAILRPTGKSTAQDFATLDKAFDDYINEHDVVPNLVIHTGRFPQWQGPGALVAHLHFIKQHQKLIKKVALVSDNPVLKGVDELVDHFVGAKIRDFPEAHFEKAVAWAEMEADDPGNFELLSGLPNDVVAIKAHGIITADDYRDMLVPLVAKKLERHEQLKLLFIIGEDFIRYASGAVWDDFRFGVMHLGDFSKIAIVSDVAWIRHSVKMFAPLMGAKVRVFHLEEEEKARSWIKT